MSALRCAFSRDTPGRKVYVQDLLEEDGAAVVDAILKHDAVVFISGSAKRMPSDVVNCLSALLVEHGGLPADGGPRAIAALERSRRLVIESWS